MKLTQNELNTINTAIENFINTYQILDYDYEDFEQGSLCLFMEQLDNAYNSWYFNTSDFINMKEDKFVSNYIEIDFDLLEKFNTAVENNTITIEQAIPVYYELEGMFGIIIDYYNQGLIELITDIEEHYENYFYELNPGLMLELSEKSDYVDFKLDIEQLLKDDYDPEIYEVDGNYYRIDNSLE